MIQIDIEMPKCCHECFALDERRDYPYPYCLISKIQIDHIFNTREKRMATRPLKEVKTKPYESKKKMPCVCGCKKRETWYSDKGYFYRCMKCGKRSKPGETEKESIKNWNMMIKEEMEKANDATH